MFLSPYRVPAEEADEPVCERDAGCPDGDLLPMLAILWIASIARVALSILRKETFGVEATLAFFVVLLVPFALRDAFLWSLQRLRRRSHPRGHAPSQRRR
jgi:hypothetical protein